MSETYLPFCIRQDGPKNKRGYFSIGKTRGLELVEGEVKHSAEGYKQIMLDIIHDASLEKSWPLSIFKVGPPYQHYALEDVCWISDGPTNNLKYIGMEHEGRVGEPLTANQITWTTRISQAIRELCPKVAANPPTRRVNLWEHRELPGTSTACPSGRIPWDAIIAALQTEDWLMALDHDQQVHLLNLTQDIWNVLFNDFDGTGPESAPRWAYWQMMLQQASIDDPQAAAVAKAIADDFVARLED